MIHMHSNKGTDRSDAAVSGHDLPIRSVSRGWAVHFGAGSVIAFCARFPR
jgi:hypothetical protein